MGNVATSGEVCKQGGRSHIHNDPASTLNACLWSMLALPS